MYISSFPKDRTAPIKILIIYGGMAWGISMNSPKLLYTHCYYQYSDSRLKLRYKCCSEIQVVLQSDVVIIQMVQNGSYSMAVRH